MFLGRDTDIQASVGDLPDADGALPGFELGSRVYLTLSDGERASFTFTPTPESIGNQTFYRPAWTADDGHGYVLESADVQLRKVGGRFHDIDSGIAYNPASAVFSDRHYLLIAPAGPISAGQRCGKEGVTRWRSQ